MRRVARSRWRQHLLFGAYVFGLLAAFYCYVLLRVRPQLFYVQKPNVFLFAPEFFAGFMDQPGGLVEYASAFLSPLFAYAWLGALVVTLLAALVCLATREFFVAVVGAGGRIVFLIPAVLILMVLGQYTHPVRLCVGLLVALGVANAYVRLGRSHAAVRLVAFVVFSALTYYAAGGLYVVFAFLCGIFELGVKRHPLMGALCLLSAVLLPIAVRAWLFDLSLGEAYRGLMLPWDPYWLAIPLSLPAAVAIRAGLLLFFPIAAIAVVWRRRRTGSPGCDPAVRARGEPSAEDAPPSDRPISGIRLAVQSMALVALAVVADVVSFDFPKRCLLEIVDGAEHQQWADVLARARRLPASEPRVWDVRTRFYVNRALYFSGDLLDRMFAYPQEADAPTLTLVRGTATLMAQTTPLECSEVLFDLGRINESEHMAYEALEVYGDRPRILKRLVYINVIKGQPEAARRFLALLERSLLHRRWARRLRRQLDADPTLSGVPVVASRRELMVARDALGEVERLEPMLEGLLEKNRHNRMAFEYLMAHYLLTRQVDKLVANLGRLDDFDYPGMPRHCEEALVLYWEVTGEQAPDPAGRKVGSQTRRGLSQFVRTLREYRGNVPAALAALRGDFGDTYFFFNVFGVSNLPSGRSKPAR